MSSKIKIAIISLQNANNFGALLQIYALKKHILNNFNSEVYVINHDWKKEKVSIQKILKNPIALLKKLFVYNSILRRFRKQAHNPLTDKFGDVFQIFRDKHLNITKNEYSNKLLISKPPEADIYITGSDQVWAVDFLFNSNPFGIF